MLPRMRTVKEAYQEIKELDSNTAITPYRIRQLVKTGAVPSVEAGKKRLVNLDMLLDYLSEPVQRIPPSGGIRPVSER